MEKEFGTAFVDGTEKTLRPAIPSSAIQHEYLDILRRAIRKMSNEVEANVKSIYSGSAVRIESSAEGATIVGDEAPAARLARQLNADYRKWEKYFKELSTSTPLWFARRISEYLDTGIKGAFKDMGLKVRIRKSGRVAEADVFAAIVAENTALIKTIPQEYLSRVSAVVNESVKHGRDLGSLTTNLERAYNITERRAQTIARDQTNKTTQSLNLVKIQAAGIEEGIWVHRSGGKVPRESHVEANGKKFRLDTGLLVDGEYIWPGLKINCHCSFRPVIPDYGDDDE